MSKLRIKDIPPAPYFARFLEGQFSGEMTEQEMQAVKGGSYVTLAYPSDQDSVPSESISDLFQHALNGKLSLPLPVIPQHAPPPGAEMVTMAYPSDTDTVELIDY